jgi:hypothetical protein
VSALAEHLIADDRADTAIVVGQGLTAEQRHHVERLVADADGARFAVAPPRPAELDLVHKRVAKNVMITEPVRLGPDRFAVRLAVDERTETLEDHLTGQHIPAVALTEAARQTWTAVTEVFLLDDATRSRFVVNEFRATFRSYVFPLPATIEYTLVGRKRDSVQEQFHCEIAIIQGGTVAATFDASYRVIPLAFCEKQEAMAARQAIRGATARATQEAALVPAGASA